jgi:hypothetical protein
VLFPLVSGDPGIVRGDWWRVPLQRQEFQKKRVVDAEDGVATIDWVVLLAALTSVGVALVDVTSEPLGIHARDVRGELAGQRPSRPPGRTTYRLVPRAKVCPMCFRRR